MSSTFYDLKNTGFSILKNTLKSNDNSRSNVLHINRLIEIPEFPCVLVRSFKKDTLKWMSWVELCPLKR